MDDGSIDFPRLPTVTKGTSPLTYSEDGTTWYDEQPRATLIRLAEALTDSLNRGFDHVKPLTQKDGITQQLTMAEGIVLDLLTAPDSAFNLDQAVDGARGGESVPCDRSAYNASISGDTEDSAHTHLIDQVQNAYDWRTQVCIDSKGDLRAGFALLKGWKPKNASSISLINPRVFAQLDDHPGAPNKSYAWGDFWGSDGSLKTEPPLKDEKTAHEREEALEALQNINPVSLETTDVPGSDAEGGGEESGSAYSYDEEDNSDWKEARGPGRDGASDDEYIQV